MEEWKTIKRLNNDYSVSNMGRLRNDKTGRVLKTKLSNKGYEWISITYKRKKIDFSIHRLVLITFDPIIDAHQYDGHHKNWDTTNNTLDNLEWLTKAENNSLRISKTESHKTLRKLISKFGDEETNKLLLEITNRE